MQLRFKQGSEISSVHVRGTLDQDEDDRDFMRYFRIVQSFAHAQGSVFFLWSPEAHDGPVGDVWCEDLSGWLVPDSKADAFEELWRTRDDAIWSDEYEYAQTFARWSEGDGGSIVIEFEFPLRAQAQE